MQTTTSRPEGRIIRDLPATDAPQPTATPQAMYAHRRAHFAAQRDAVARRWNRVANLRLLLFVLAAAAALARIWITSPFLLPLAGVLFVGFLVAVVYHTRLGAVLRRLDVRVALNDEGLYRLARDWNALPLRVPDEAITPPTFAHDLDLLGHASLQHLLNTPATPAGLTTLQRWLAHPADPPTIAARQATVRELAVQSPFREDLAAEGQLLETTQRQYELFVEWAEDANWLHDRPVVVWASRVLPLVLLALAIAVLNGALPTSVVLPLIAVNMLLIATVGRRAAHDIERVAGRRSVFGAYARLFGLVLAQRPHAPLTQDLQHELRATNVDAEHQMQRLTRIMNMADLRLWLLYVPFNIVTLWDFHVQWLLERWRGAAGAHARRWLAVLGEIEALVALATASHDHPHWTFPHVADDEDRVRAEGLAHPLLPPAISVGNDAEVGPPGTFLLVTGSNMSGKSTLLRSIGLNAALAQAGGPVCARALRMPPLRLATSMRVEDSLEQGVSYFMAELQRLKEVVDLTRDTRDRRVLFLLDEILHGTNTQERQIAARMIIRYLVEQGAIGAVSTHDLALADAPDLAAIQRPVHFTETFTRGPDGPEMHFDYRLRPGVATSTNALKLMEIVGLMVDIPPA
jgi:hypothetical protein